MSSQQPNEVVFSFVCPLVDEQADVEAFHRALSAAAARLEQPYEIIYVNDGCEGRTDQVLRRLAGEETCVRVVELSRPFGHEAAILAGYDHARGRAVISLAADGRDPPELIAQLVARWREGFEVVCTTRRERPADPRGPGLLRRARAAVLQFVGGVAWADSGDFRLLDRAAVTAVRQVTRPGSSLRQMVRWIGFRQTTIPYAPEPAEKMSSPRDRSGRGGRRLGWWQSLLGPRAAARGPGVGQAATAHKPSLRPALRLAAAVGGLLVCAAALYAFVSLILWPFGAAPGALAHVAMIVAAVAGLQLLLLALVGEYVARAFAQPRAEPQYIVRQRYGFRAPAEAEAQAAEEPSGEAPPRPHDAEGINIYT